LHQVGTSSLLIYMMHGHTYIKFSRIFPSVEGVLVGTRLRSWLRHGATNRKVAGSVPVSVIGVLNFLRPHYGPGIDSASNRNEYQEYFLGGKGGRCVGLTTLAPSCADCLEIWEPQPPGTLRVCPGL